MDNLLLAIRIFIKTCDNFSEDLDFDCKEMSEEEFLQMTDSVVRFLRNNNIDVETT